jgi:hypothetical protein
VSCGAHDTSSGTPPVFFPPFGWLFFTTGVGRGLPLMSAVLDSRLNIGFFGVSASCRLLRSFSRSAAEDAGQAVLRNVVVVVVCEE